MATQQAGALLQQLQSRMAVNNSNASSNPAIQEQVKAVPDQAQRRVEYFFRRLEGIHPNRYRAVFKTEQAEAMAKSEWKSQISQLNKSMMDVGFEKSKQKAAEGDRDHSWPNIPAVLALCKPCLEDFGIPSLADAYREACNHSDSPASHKWSHRVVYLAGKTAGWYELRGNTGSYEKTQKSFEYAFKALCSRILAGEDIEPCVSLAIEDQSRIGHLEAAERLAEQKQRQVMANQGINPSGGYAEFRKAMKLI